MRASVIPYRAEIDGLRAIAVVVVMRFHAGFSPFSGDFIGVDLFFVISGFLITSMMLTEMAQQRFSLRQFYERRARRILPALFLVMGVTLPFSWLWLYPAALIDYAQSLIAIPAFVSNILFWQETGYWEAESTLKPLLHTWSLAVEEQYYLLFPLLMGWMWRCYKRAIPYLLLLIMVVSVGGAQWMAGEDSAANFYLLPTRIWELMMGGLLAYWIWQ